MLKILHRFIERFFLSRHWVLGSQKFQPTFTAILLVLGAIGNAFGQEDIDLRVMSFNVFSAEQTPAGRTKLVEILQTSGADIIGAQEVGLDPDLLDVANSLGFHYARQSAGSAVILSRFPIINSSTSGYGVEIEYTPGHSAWLFNIHFAPYPYQPYDVRDGTLVDEASVIAAATAVRGAAVTDLLNDMTTALASDIPVFLTGDFNEPSHLDWTQAAADATARPYDFKVEFPTSKSVVDAGLTDSFREVRPDEANDHGYTWTPGLSATEVHDRIDFVYYTGDDVSVNDSITIGADASNPSTDIEVTGFNSDHRAVFSDFTLADQVGSTLTFSRLDHDPGDDSALNAGNYGDYLETTPNIAVEFQASGTSVWDTYDGDEDFNGDNHWNVGVAQLQFGGGSADYDLTFTPDAGYGVLVDSLDLVNYVGYTASHTVDWELWEGAAGTGTLLANGQEVVAPDDINSIMTGVNDPTFGDVTLRLTHLLGSGQNLAVDNIAFSQASAVVPEPSGVLPICAIGITTLVFFKRRSKRHSEPLKH